jgi:hypothetical protein
MATSHNRVSIDAPAVAGLPRTSARTRDRSSSPPGVVPEDVNSEMAAAPAGEVFVRDRGDRVRVVQVILVSRTSPG